MVAGTRRAGRARRGVEASLFQAADAAAGSLGLVAAAALAAALGAKLFHTFFGDPAIYLPYARNAAHGDLFSYNPHAFSSGSTSPLWALLLAIPYALGAGVVGVKVLAIVAGALALAVTVAAARRLSGSFTAAAAGAFFVVGALLFYSSIVYESALAVGASSASLVACDAFSRRELATRRDAVGGAVPVALAWAVLPLARPDEAVLVLLQFGALCAFGTGRAARRVAVLSAAAAVALLPAAAYYGYSQLELGAYSVSGVARAFALREQRSLLVHIGPLRYSGPAWAYVVASLIAVAAAAVGLTWARRERRMWLAAYGLGALGAYALLLLLVQPATNDADRYFLPVAPIIAAGVALAIVRTAHAARRADVRAAAAPLVLLAAAAIVRPSSGLGQAAIDVAVLAGAAVLAVSRRGRAPGVGTGAALALLAVRLVRRDSTPVSAIPHWISVVALALVVVAIASLVAGRFASRAAAVAASLGAGALVFVALAAPVKATWDRSAYVATLPYPLDTIVERALIEHVNRIAPPHATLLVYEAQDRYYLRPDLELLSLDGITDGKVIPYLDDHRLGAFLRRYQPELWAAGDSVVTRPYLRKSILLGIYRRLLAGAVSARADGIVFRVLARRPTAVPVGFSGWRLLLRLSYGGRRG